MSARSGTPNVILVGVVFEGRLASVAASKEDIVDDVWDAPGVAGMIAPPSFTSPTIVLT